MCICQAWFQLISHRPRSICNAIALVTVTKSVVQWSKWASWKSFTSPSIMACTVWSVPSSINLRKSEVNSQKGAFETTEIWHFWFLSYMLCAPLVIIQMLQVAIPMALFCSSVLVSNGSMTERQHAQYQDLETDNLFNYLHPGLSSCDMSKCPPSQRSIWHWLHLQTRVWWLLLHIAAWAVFINILYDRKL